MTDNQGSPHSASHVPQRSVQFGPVDVSNTLIEAQTESGPGATSAGTFKFNFGESPLCQDQVRHQGQQLLVELEG